MEYKDYYKILGVKKDASQAEIKKVFRKLAKENHPDTKAGDKKAEERFKEISEAYEVLGDEEKRKKYDSMGSEFNFGQGMNFDPSAFGRRGQASGFSDFFDLFFGGSAGFDMKDIFGRNETSYYSSQYPIEGSDVEAEIEITPEDGFEGAERKIRINVENEPKTISFKIPKGIREGEKIKIQGQGTAGTRGGKNGDLFLRVKFSNKSRFEIIGTDLYAVMDVYPWEAALGAEKAFETLDKKIMVKIPEGIKSDNKIRIPGGGYYDSRNTRGDLFIKIRINNPAVLTKEQMDLYKELARR